MRNFPKIKMSSNDLSYISNLFTKTQMIPGSIRTFWYKHVAKTKESHKVIKRNITFKSCSPELNG